VQGLEWWLDAHISLASELLCLEQQLEALYDDAAHTETMRRLTAHTEAVRDALYELYCDAADPRMALHVGPGAPLEKQVRGTYAWCSKVVALLTSVTSGLGAGGPDWGAAKADFREATRSYVAPNESLRDAVRGLLIDFTSPVEPLRNLQQDIEQLFATTAELQGILAKRFG
jgi:hypothetical protein